MIKNEGHWDLPRTPENAWLFTPNFDVNEEDRLAEVEKNDNHVILKSQKGKKH